MEGNYRNKFCEVFDKIAGKTAAYGGGGTDPDVNDKTDGDDGTDVDDETDGDDGTDVDGGIDWATTAIYLDTALAELDDSENKKDEL